MARHACGGGGHGLRVGFIFRSASTSARAAIDFGSRPMGTCGPVLRTRTRPAWDLLRNGADDTTLERAIRAMVMGKPEGHDCGLDDGTVFEGVMTGIGG